MSHEPSVKRMLKQGTPRWVDLGDATYAVNGYCAVRIVDPVTIAWLKAAHTTVPELQGLESVIASARAAEAKPTDVLADPTGVLCRVFWAPTGLLAVNVTWLSTWCGKHDALRLRDLTWTTTETGEGAVAGWAAGECHVVAMPLNLFGRPIDHAAETLALLDEVGT